MRLSSVHEERMTEIYRPGVTGSQHFRPGGRLLEAVGRQFSQTEPCITSRGEPTCDIQVRTSAYACWSIILTDIGEQEQHQQRPPLRVHVHSPVQEVACIAILGSKAHVDVPARVAGVICVGESNRERAERAARKPAPGTHELVESPVEHPCIRGCPERFLWVHPEPDHRSRPRRRVMFIAPQIAPQDRPRLCSKLTRKRSVDSHVPIVHERVNVCVPEHSRQKFHSPSVSPRANSPRSLRYERKSPHSLDSRHPCRPARSGSTGPHRVTPATPQTRAATRQLQPCPRARPTPAASTSTSGPSHPPEPRPPQAAEPPRHARPAPPDAAESHARAFPPD